MVASGPRSCGDIMKSKLACLFLMHLLLISLGALAYLTKPFKAEELLGIVKKALSL